ncbi:hypothetical protein G3R49_12640 [Shewanella sp. WXL01]|uniref:glycoside hydrolase family 26 protein n=1 Tax=Shewanella sp. WXL01 TaxID=2709721 RepID=UPI00143867A9|nr:glycosyl hydrolase [Shewanella sp. WXL01]NKF51406.1 hypothetical protein [Shewanella sp. WXL01]
MLTKLQLTGLIGCLLTVSTSCASTKPIDVGSNHADKTNVASAVNDTAKAALLPAHTKLLPADNKLLLFVGQDSDTIAQYQQAIPQDKLEGVTLYTTLKTADANIALPAVYQSADWNSGEVSFSKTLSKAPKAALAIGLAFDSCNDVNHSENIASGAYDASIAKLADYLTSLAPRQVFLRIGYEFDGPWNCYSPSSYKQAFKRVASHLNKRNLDNVATVWQSAAWPDPTIAGDNRAQYSFNNKNHLNDWYPGDEYVDWIGVSVFYRDLKQWAYTPPYTPDFAQQQILQFARHKQKPILIAEAAPQAYRTGALTHSYIQKNTQKPISAEQLWQDWYQPLFDFIYANQDVIRALAYINTHWETQGMWHCAEDASPPNDDCRNGNWGDSRVQANPYIQQKWLEQISNPQKWIQAE